MLRRGVSGLVCVCLLCTALCASAVSATAATAFSQDFTALKAGDALPSGFEKSGSVSVKDGCIEIGAGGVLLLPASVSAKDFTYEVDFTIASATSSSRWAGFLFRRQSAAKYMQMCCRQNAAGAGGIDCSLQDGGWSYPENGKGTYLTAIDPARRYTAKIAVKDGRVGLSVNGTLCVITTTLLDAAGGFGVQANGSTVRVYGVRVSDPTDIPTSIPDGSEQVKQVYEPTTGIVGAPTVLQTIDTAAEWDALKASGARPQVARFTLTDKNLNVRAGGQVRPLSEVLAHCGTAVLPLFYTSDKDTAVAFSKYISEHGTLDVILASDNAAALTAAWKENSYGVRYAYDAGELTAQNTVSLVSRTAHTAAASIVLLRQNAQLTRSAAEYLQLRGLSVWMNGTGSDTDRVCAAIDCGANGVEVEDFAVAYGLYEKVTAQTLVRKAFFVGHRGMPSVAPENSKEGYLAAIAAGADAIECDVQITKDKVLISNHNATVDGYTTDTAFKGAVSSYTWAQLESKTLKAVGSYTASQFCKMEWYFDILKDNPAVVGYVEFKDSTDETLRLTVQMIEQKGLQDQIVFICFSDAALKQLYEYSPYAGRAALSSPLTDVSEESRMVQLLKSTGFSAASPNYGAGLSDALIKAGRHRGILFQEWTVNAQSTALRKIRAGTTVITTDRANYAQAAELQTYKTLVARTLFGLADVPVSGTTATAPQEGQTTTTAGDVTSSTVASNTPTTDAGGTTATAPVVSSPTENETPSWVWILVGVGTAAVLLGILTFVLVLVKKKETKG